MDWSTAAAVVGTLSAIVIPPLRSLVKTTYKVREDLATHEAIDNVYQQNVDVRLTEVKEAQRETNQKLDRLIERFL